MVACTGWTWDYVRDYMDIPRLKELNEYYSTNPPLHIMVKAYLGYKEPEAPIQVDSDEGSLDDLLSSIPRVER